jgi:predicted Zn-dependent peptidase
MRDGLTAEASARTLLGRLEEYRAAHPEEPLGDTLEAVLAMVAGLLAELVLERERLAAAQEEYRNLLAVAEDRRARLAGLLEAARAMGAMEEGP